VRRNSDGAGKYRPFHAHKLAQRSRRRERKGKIAASPELRAEIEELMGKSWSPAQISRHLRTSHPDDPTRRVVHETIYRDIYDWRRCAGTRPGSCGPSATGAGPPGSWPGAAPASARTS
jgi:IS30 family transposase